MTNPLLEYSLVYLGSPYSKYPDGIEAAFQEVSCIAARLLEQGVNVFCPIAHSHPLAEHGGLDPLDHSIWMPANTAYMGKSDALVIATMRSWKQSVGLHHEIEWFAQADKPIFFVDPETLEIERMQEWTILPLSH